MMSSAKTHLILATLVLFAALAAYGSWYAVVSSRSAESAKLAAEIQSKGQDAESLKQAKTALASISDDEAQVAAYFVSTADVVAFLEGLQAAGAKLGSTVTIASVSANTEAARPTLALTLQINGSFDAVLRTIGSIEYGPYFVTVSDLSLSTTPTSAASASTPGRPAGWSATASLIVGAENPASSTPPRTATPPAPVAASSTSSP